MGVKVTQGTETDIYVKTNSGTAVQVVKLDIGSGTALADFGGTITRVTELLKGTMTSLVAGTVSTLGLTHADAWATVVSTGTTGLGTIKGSVAGSSIYITDMIISVGSASTVVIASGGTSTPIIGSLQFAQYGGMVSNFRTPIFTAAGSPLVYQQSVGCPLSITCQGYIK